MDEKTLAILNELAARLGTTAEYLWGVLITQAPISGIVDILGIALLVGCFLGWTKFVHRKVSEGDWEEEMGVFFAWFSVFISGAIIVLIVATSMSMIAAAFLNPEYWALKQILR